MESEKRVVLPPKWIEILRDYVKVETPTLSTPLSRAAEWLTVGLPMVTSLCWHTQLITTLREGLALFAMASHVDSRVWEDIGLSSYHPNERNVCYRFRIRDRLTDVVELLDQRHPFSASFQQARDRIYQLQTSRPAAQRVPISLVIQPRCWNPRLLNEISALCMTTPSGWVIRYEITTIELDLKDTRFSDTTVFALLRFLQSEMPVSTLTVSIDETWWSQQDVMALIRIMDRPSTTFIKIVLRTKNHYGTVTTALANIAHLQFVEVDVSSAEPLPKNSLSPVITRCMLGSLWWTAHDTILPPQFHAVQALGLSIDQKGFWMQSLVTVGRCLRSLQLFGDRASVQLEEIFEVCPLLERLELNGVLIESLDTIMDRHDSRLCVLRSLVLEQVDITDMHSVARLATALHDSNSPTAQTLFDLALIPKTGNVQPEIVRRLADVLDTNSRLRNLHLKVSANAKDVMRLRRHHFEPILAYDHALLGIVNDHRTPPAVKQLCDDVIGEIFAFAGIHEHRTIRIFCSEVHNPHKQATGDSSNTA